MIPKIIHYCWFGGNPIPKKFLKYIDTWKKFFPDYEIKRWDESNFDINCCDYVREAYLAKKYAFVSDFARFKILFDEGGLYFDTDVEVIKNFDDILYKDGFFGCEIDSVIGSNKAIAINPGLGLAARPGLDIYKELLKGYYERHFINSDGSYNLTTIVTYTTEILTKYGLEEKAEIQEINGIVIYPKEYFNPINMSSGKIEKTSNTYSIHHFAASWETKENRFRGKVYNIIYRVFGKKIALKIRKIFGKK